MSRPVLLDLFCGAGGASVGYHRAGFDVVGVDLVMRPGYPFQRVQADALRFAADHGHHFDAIHASPPCQAYSISTADRCKASHPDLLAPTRDALDAIGRPWVIENVPGAPMRADYKLCGCMFGLPNLKRERWFETSWHGFDLRPPCSHREPAISVTGGGMTSWNIKSWGKAMRGDELKAARQQAIGIDWIDSTNDLALAIPPAYAEYIGYQLIEHLGTKAVAS